LKKILLLLVLFSSVLFAEANLYIGAGYAYNSETVSYDGADKTIDNNAARLKVGYGERDGYAVEFSFDYVDNKSNIFANPTGSNDGKKYGFNIELLKAWDFDIFVNPFLKAGFGAGYLETPADQYNGSLTYGSFNLGGGIFIPLSESIDVEIAYEYKYLSYQKIDTDLAINPTANLNIGYIGMNFRF